jgi:hypothetical protein
MLNRKATKRNDAVSYYYYSVLEEKGSKRQIPLKFNWLPKVYQHLPEGAEKIEWAK